MAADRPASPAADATGSGVPAARAAALLVAAVALSSATAFAGAFQFDDWNVIVDDPTVADLGAWWRAMPAIRPLLKLTFALDRQAGLGTVGFHAANLAFHAAASLLALALLRRLEGWFAIAPPPAGRVPGAALLGALLFALHPIQTEAVTYLSGRSASLAGLLALAAALAWVEGRARGRPWLVHGLSPLLLLLSLAVKETAVALPLALLLLGAAPAALPGAPGRWRRVLVDLGGHALALGAALTAYLAAGAYRTMLGHAGTLRPPLENLRVQLGGVAWLVGQVLRPDRLLADPGPPAAGPWWPAALTALALLAALAAALSALLLGPRAPWGLGATPPRRAAALALLWWLVWLPPTGWLWPRPEAANDRQAYLPLLGPAWLLARWLTGGGAGPRARGLAGVTAALLVLSLGLATAARNLVYRDEVAFWTDVVAKAPGNARARNNLGLALSAGCRFTEAEAAFEAALVLDPGASRPRLNLWLLRQGEPPGAVRGQVVRCPPPVSP